MATAVAPVLPEEDWDDELTLPSGPLDWEQIVNQATATEGSETHEDVPLVETADRGAPTQIEPRADAEGQTRVLMEPPRGNLDTTLGESVEVPIPDRPPIVEATSGVIEMEMAEASEHPEDTTLGVVDEGAEATPASLPAPMPHLGV